MRTATRRCRCCRATSPTPQDAAVAGQVAARAGEVVRVAGATRFATAVAVAGAPGFAEAADAAPVILVRPTRGRPRPERRSRGSTMMAGGPATRCLTGFPYSAGPVLRQGRLCRLQGIAAGPTPCGAETDREAASSLLGQ